MKKKLRQIVSRRQAMQLLGVGGLYCTSFDPVAMLFRCLVEGMISEAQAAAPVKNYISIIAPGAPPRWMWDGFLNPNNEAIVANAAVQNYITDSTYTGISANTNYRSEAVTLSGGSKVYLPPLWNRNIPTSSGSTVPMNALLNNTLMIRGVDMQLDLGHVIGPAKVVFPIGAPASLSGLAGDGSSKSLPVVGTSLNDTNFADPMSQGYQSLLGTSSTLINSTGANSSPIATAMSPFINSDANVVANASTLNSSGVQAAIQNALSQAGTYAAGSLPGSNVLYKNLTNAQSLFLTQFGNLQAVYTTLYNKYQGLINSCASTAIPGIIPASGINGYALGASKFASTLAGQFAVAEYLLTNGFSSVISMNMSGGYGAPVGGITSYGGNANPGNDEHTSPDRQFSVIYNSFNFLSLSAVLYELRNALINAGIWNQTVVHISSEFGRIPTISSGVAQGTGHLTVNNAVTIMSGAISQAMFIGNVYTNPSTLSNPPGGYGVQTTPGSYGVGAPVATSTGTQTITNNTCANTVAAILGVQPLFTATPSLVSVDGTGTVTASLAEAPKSI